MKKSKVYLGISVVSYFVLMILNKLLNVPDIIYFMIMAFSIILMITAINEQKNEGD